MVQVLNGFGFIMPSMLSRCLGRSNDSREFATQPEIQEIIQPRVSRMGNTRNALSTILSMSLALLSFCLTRDFVERWTKRRRRKARSQHIVIIKTYQSVKIPGDSGPNLLPGCKNRTRHITVIIIAVRARSTITLR